MIKNYKSLLKNGRNVNLEKYLTTCYLRHKSPMLMDFLIQKNTRDFDGFLDPPRELSKLANDLDQPVHLLNAWRSLSTRNLTLKPRAKFTYQYGDFSGHTTNIMDNRHIIITDNMFIYIVHNKVLRNHATRIGKTAIEFNVPIAEIDFFTPLTIEEVYEIVKPTLLFYKLKYPDRVDLNKLL